MGLIHKVRDVETIRTENGNSIDNTNIEFTLDEVDILIRVIAGASFPVRDIEPLYKAILKLQRLRKKLESYES
jgi:hypothetical protein